MTFTPWQAEFPSLSLSPILLIPAKLSGAAVGLTNRNGLWETTANPLHRLPPTSQSEDLSIMDSDLVQSRIYPCSVSPCYSM